MELSPDAVLVNTAIASDPVASAQAFAAATHAGRLARELGLDTTSQRAIATSPLTAFLG